MIELRGQFRVARPLPEVWAYLSNLEDFARCVPTLKAWHIEGGVVHGKVGVTLGVVPVESQVRMQVEVVREGACIEARGASYLGQTITDLRGARAGEVQPGDTGQLLVHLDVRSDGPGVTFLSYLAGVEAQGRLRKIYESIVRLKVPAMRREFAQRFALALDAEVTEVSSGDPMCQQAEEIARAGTLAPATPASHPATAAPAAPAPALAAVTSSAPPGPAAPGEVTALTTPSAPRRGLWARLLSWLRGLLRR
ncbi:MAG: hypothetical protein IT370_13240 [Deltaproteobacteria bacterium]|nr:hypothetical protein [Deltaproteobacteria bacterium]